MEKVLNKFRIQCSSCRIEPINNRLTHKYYYLNNSNTKKSNYLLQRVYGNTFNNTRLLMKNVSLVLNCLDNHDREGDVGKIKFVSTKDGVYHFRDQNGDYWRVCQIISKQKFNILLQNGEYAFSWARTFSEILYCMDELPFHAMNNIPLSESEIHYLLDNLVQLIHEKFFSPRNQIQDTVFYVLNLRIKMKQAGYLIPKLK